MIPSPLLIVGYDFFEMSIMLITFLIIVILAYYVSRFVGKQSYKLQNRQNIKVVESVQILPQKYIQIVKIGKKYYALSSTKDNISLICEIREEDLDLSISKGSSLPFKELLDKHMKKKSESVTKNGYKDS